MLFDIDSDTFLETKKHKMYGPLQNQYVKIQKQEGNKPNDINTEENTTNDIPRTGNTGFLFNRLYRLDVKSMIFFIIQRGHR